MRKSEIAKTRLCNTCDKRKKICFFPVAASSGTTIYYRRTCKECRKRYEDNWKEKNSERYLRRRRQYYSENRDREIKRACEWHQANREYSLNSKRLWYLANAPRLKEKQSRWYYSNPDTVIAYRENNKEQISDKNRLWKKNNRVYVIQYNLNWRKNNADHVKKYSREYDKMNPERKRLSEAKRRALKMGCTTHMIVSANELKKIYKRQQGKCMYCGKRLRGRLYHIDHIVPLSRGGIHSVENMQLTCPQCNISKHARTHEEYLEYLRIKRAGYIFI
jgi:5-methylcytosine-specific restriction endonuclease McrA